MPSIHETVDIRADPEAVFDLITRMEEFPRYAHFIKKVHVTGPKKSHWTARVLGLWLEWDSLVTECERPRRFAWQSTKGAATRGSYTLERIPGGTKLSFFMEYRFPNSLVEMTLGPLAAPFAREGAARALARVKRQLERAKGTSHEQVSSFR